MCSKRLLQLGLNLLQLYKTQHVSHCFLINLGPPFCLLFLCKFISTSCDTLSFWARVLTSLGKVSSWMGCFWTLICSCWKYKYFIHLVDSFPSAVRDCCGVQSAFDGFGDWPWLWAVPRLLRAVRGSEGTALCDAQRADVPLHLWPVWDAVSVQTGPDLTL